MKMRTGLLLLVVSVLTCFKLGVGVIVTSTVSEGSSKYCPGSDIILKCNSTSYGQIRWTSKVENSVGPSYVFDNTTTATEAFRRNDNLNFSAIYYISLGLSYLIYRNAYTNFNFTCNRDKMFNVIKLEEPPVPGNVSAYLSNESINVTWLEPDKDSEAVDHYIVGIEGSTSPQIVNCTQYTFEVGKSIPEVVYVMVVDVCGRISKKVNASVLVTTTSMPSTGGAIEQPISVVVLVAVGVWTILLCLRRTRE